MDSRKIRYRGPANIIIFIGPLGKFHTVIQCELRARTEGSRRRTIFVGDVRVDKPLDIPKTVLIGGHFQPITKAHHDSPSGTLYGSVSSQVSTLVVVVSVLPRVLDPCGYEVCPFHCICFELVMKEEKNYRSENGFGLFS